MKGFDGLRAISALLVFVEHKVRDLGTGAIGVWVFFCLSGYLIVGILHRARLVLERSPGTSSHRQELADFWRNRALRILPIYYLVLIPAFALGHLEPPQAFPYYFFYLQNFYIAFVSHHWSAISHFWSLAIEQQFYVLAAPLLLFVASRRHERFLAIVLAACVASTVIAEWRGWDPMAISLMPSTNFAFMALGGMLYLARPSSLARRAFGSTVLSGLVAVVFCVVFLLTRPTYDPQRGTALVVYLLGLPFAAAAIGWTAWKQESALVRLLETRPMRWLGTISYGFYVLHPFMPSRERVARMLSMDWIGTIPAPVWNLAELAGALAAAHLSWCYFERRFLLLKKRVPAQGTT